ncbi:MAG: ROK family protein [Ancrocorticia sp.]
MEDIIGIDVGGTWIKWGRATSDGILTDSGKVPTERENPLGVLTKIANIVSSQEGVTKVGLSFPGIVGRDGRLITVGSIYGLEGCHLREEIERLTGLPVTVINDAHSAGQAERWLGAGADCDNFVCITIGTGLGGAIFINGKLYRGSRGAAGELSMALLGTGSTRGELFEVLAGNMGSGIFGLSRYYSQELGITESAEWFTDTWEILRLAEEGDEHAIRATDRFFDGLTSLLVTLLATLDPDRFLLGGGVSGRPGFLTETHKRLAEKIRNHPNIDHDYIPELRLCVNGNDSGVLGAIHAAHTLG